MPSDDVRVSYENNGRSLVRSNYVYVMRRSDGAHKVGYSKHPYRRRETLSVPGSYIQLIHTVERPGDAYEVEQAAHRIMRDKRLDGEWFEVGDAVALAAINRAVQEHGKDADHVAQQEVIRVRQAVWQAGIDAVEKHLRRTVTRDELSQIEATPEMAQCQQAAIDDRLTSKEVEANLRIRRRHIAAWVKLLERTRSHD